MADATATLADFLLARIAEDEAVARKASHQKLAGPFHGNWRSDSLALSVIPDSADRAHIARHDPARVLAECEAKRRIVELHRPRESRWPECSVCVDDMAHPSPMEWMREAYPCPTLRLLALSYADHPDYREEWRP